MSSHYMQSGNAVYLIGNGSSVIKKLPGSTFVVKKNPATGQFFLEVVDDMSVPSTIYGSAKPRVDRIINTYNERTVSTGVMLSGEKGSGKTLLTKLISAELRTRGIPTIIVNTAFCGEEFNTFIAGIDEEVLIIFDEFEKVYKPEHQEMLLTLLDGTFTHKKMFIITVNEINRTNSYLNNRPGRIYYNYKYQGLEEDFIRDYCQDNLVYKDKIPDIVSYAKMFAQFNFDMLKAMVEELNRYNETVLEVVNHININPQSGNTNRYIGELIDIHDYRFNKTDWKLSQINYGRSFNPFQEEFNLYLERIVKTQSENDNETVDILDNDDDYDGNSYYMTFRPTDLIELSRSGKFLFRNNIATICLTVEETKKFSDILTNAYYSSGL